MASLNIPYSFTNGTIANATEVNAINTAIKAFVETETVQRDGSVKVTAAGIENNAVTNAKLDYTTVPRTTVSSTEPTSPKAGDIWVQI